MYQNEYTPLPTQPWCELCQKLSRSYPNTFLLFILLPDRNFVTRPRSTVKAPSLHLFSCCLKFFMVWKMKRRSRKWCRISKFLTARGLKLCCGVLSCANIKLNSIKKRIVEIRIGGDKRSGFLYSVPLQINIIDNDITNSDRQIHWKYVKMWYKLKLQNMWIT